MEQTSILVALDGYDEEFYHCKDVGVMEEVRRIVSQENNKHFNPIVTTRPWKRLLHERYKEISIATEMTVEKKHNLLPQGKVATTTFLIRVILTLLSS